MKYKSVKIISVFAVILLYSCITTGDGTGSSLRDAIELSADEITANLPAKSRVAIIQIQSANDNLSEYIIEELTFSLFQRKIEVADRQNLDYVLNELKFQMSGYVSDESAQSIGKFIGAQYVITGQLRDIGGAYNLMINAVSVEKATRASVSRFDVKKDSAFNRMVAGLGGRTRVQTPNTEPVTAGAFLDRGILFASRGDYDMAIADFNEAISIDPNFFAAYLNRGWAYYDEEDERDINNSDRAIEDFTSAIRLDPNSSTAYQARGAAYIHRKNDSDRAILDLNITLSLDPNNSWAYHDRGVAYSRKGDYDRAIEDLNKSIQIENNWAPAYANRGNVYYETKDYVRALEDVNQSTKIDSSYVWAWLLRGQIYMEMKDFNRAIENFDQVIRLDSGDLWAYVFRAGIYRDLNDFDRAIEDYSKAISIDPTNFDWMYSARGSIYLDNKGDYDRAIADLETAIRLGNTEQWVKDNLETARRRGR